MFKKYIWPAARLASPQPPECSCLYGRIDLIPFRYPQFLDRLPDNLRYKALSPAFQLHPEPVARFEDNPSRCIAKDYAR